MIADFGNNWGFWMLLTELPIYMKNILHYDIKEVSDFHELEPASCFSGRF